MKLFASESLCRRQLGVLIFQLRTFLDSLDGVVFRARSHSKLYKSHHGDFGYYVDALSDILGGTCLMIGCLLYLYKERPARAVARRANLCPSPSPTEDGCEEKDLMMLNIDSEPPSTRIQLSPSSTSDTLLESKDRILIAMLLFSARYIAAAGFWDRYVVVYEDLLDKRADAPYQQVRH